MALDEVKQSVEQNLTNAYNKALDKGATEPENKNLENLASTIDSIVGGEVIGYSVESVINEDGETQTLKITTGGGIQPSGTIEITENNKTYDVTNYASANVNVPAIGTGLNELILMGKWIGSSDDPNYALLGETCIYFESNKHFTATIDNVTNMSGEYTIDGQNVHLMDDVMVLGYDAETGLLITEGAPITFTKVDVREGQPIKVSKETAMADLAEEFNVGNVFEFVGTSDTYETGALYIVSEV